MDYLYHYTSIETLALILSNRKIRLNRLDKVDDPQEQIAKEIADMGKLVFVSSWTDDSDESIPMWKMYGSLESGVRIKLRKYPFEENEPSVSELQEIPGMIVEESQETTLPKTVISIADMFKRKYTIPGLIQQKDMLFKVEYTKDTDKLYPSVLSMDGEAVIIATNKMGKYKNTHWEFQHEWRYILPIYPFDSLDTENHERNLAKLRQDFLKGTITQHVEYHDLTIDHEAFSDMEITMSPRISAGNRVILKDLVEKYNPDAKILESSLLGLL